MTKKDELPLYSKRIISLREGLDLSQKVLGSLCGVTAAAVTMWETGKRFPRGKNLQELARALGVSPSFIIDENTVSSAKPATSNPELKEPSPQLKIDALEAKIDALDARIPAAPTPDPKDLEDAAKWREFEAKYLPLGQDLIEKLMTIDLKDKIFLWDYFGLPEHPNILAAKRKIRAEAHKQESQPAPHKQAVDYPHRKK